MNENAFILLKETTAEHCFTVIQIEGEKKVNCEASRKTSGGLEYFYGWYDSINKPRILELFEQNTSFTPRPYQLRQSCDGTIGSCVLALFFKFCAAFNYLPEELLKQSDKDDILTQEEKELIVERADWEGVVYPITWDEEARAGLMMSLAAINYHSLTGVLYGLPELAGFDWSTERFSDVPFTTAEKVYEILQRTGDGSDLTPNHWELVKRAFMLNEKDLGKQDLSDLHELYRTVRANLYLVYLRNNRGK